MGAFHGAEACEFVGLYLLHLLVEKGYFPKGLVGLYRDDGLGVSDLNTEPPHCCCQCCLAGEHLDEDNRGRHL